ncbi:MAG: ABC transporter ATP-binding protein [Nitriliruptorales bacterium]|nr:ABC transporter ATP-binding protein [Nitriliruptorales bacterium]
MNAPAEVHNGQAVKIRGLVKRYGQLRAVDELDLDVPRGGIFGLIGPNGAGKTTTMLAIVTLLDPDAGAISVLGHDPRTDIWEVRRRVGYMPDFFGVYDGLTCAEYLEFFAGAYQVTGAERRAQVDALLELVELDHKRDTDVSGLSRGMQQRLSLARSLVHDPELLVLDEPASGLDPRARVELREIMLELSRQGHTILVSSHILAELEEMCDRVGIIEAGSVLAQGTPDEIRVALRTTLTCTVRALGGEPALEQIEQIAIDHGATSIERVGTGVRFEVVGGEEAAATILAALVGAGVRVVDFREDRGGLERLFLSVTKGIVR